MKFIWYLHVHFTNEFSQFEGFRIYEGLDGVY